MLDAELRQLLRQAVDDAVRARLDPHEPRCAGCGTDLDGRTIGCRTCCDRHRRWQLRSSEEYRQRERERDRYRRRRPRKVAA